MLSHLLHTSARRARERAPVAAFGRVLVMTAALAAVSLPAPASAGIGSVPPGAKTAASQRSATTTPPSDPGSMSVAVSTSLLHLLIPSYGLRLELPLGGAWSVRVGGFIGQQVEAGPFIDKWVWDLDARATAAVFGTRQRGLLVGVSARHRWQEGLLVREPEDVSARSRQARLHAVIAARWTGSVGVFIGVEAGGGATREWLHVDRATGDSLRATTTRASMHGDLTIGWMWR